MLAAVRPDSWNLPLLLHVLGASLLLGALITAAVTQVLGWKGRSSADVVPYARLVFRTLLYVAIPAWFLMWGGGLWVADREGWADVAEDPTWLVIGFTTAEPGGALLLISTILAGIGARRLGRSGGEQGATLVRISTVISLLLVVAYVVAVWAMSAKPS
jgi:hypothetical protein